jgi:beta-glucosidase
MAEKLFPDNFIWGAGTSACQVEGSPLANGAGPSIWHAFAREPGRIANGDTPDIACDHYRRHEEDIRLMAQLGLGAYRFSIAWGRVLPKGRGKLNHSGLDHYQRLVDSLLRHGIQPMICLYHWDLPLALEGQGGWQDADLPKWFADYAALMFEALDDRVPWWLTLNEPGVFADGGYRSGDMAPGLRQPALVPKVLAHQIQAHQAAVAAYRELGRHQIGIALNLEPQNPASDSEPDHLAAARRHAYINEAVLGPLLHGRFPQAFADIFGPGYQPESFDTRPSLDFLGINYYAPARVRADPKAFGGFALVPPAAGEPQTAMGWYIDPNALARALKWAQRQLGDLPIFITENGAAFDDPPAEAGRIRDEARIQYLREHLLICRDLIAQGLRLRGYFAWSLFDNFEWHHGYAKRFGLVAIDQTSGERLPKDSAWFYRDCIQSGCELFNTEES